MSAKRRDRKNRILQNGESQKPDGRYAFKYCDIMDTYTHLGLQDAWEELQRLELEFSQRELKLIKTA